MNSNIFQLKDEMLPKLAEVLKALGHCSRLRLFEALADGEKTVSQLSAMLLLHQATISQHLKVMRSANVVTFRREGNQSIYCLAHPGLSDLLQCLRNCQGKCS